MNTEQRLVALIRRMNVPPSQRWGLSRRRTYSPGRRVLGAMSTRMLVRETFRRFQYAAGEISKRDRDMLAAEYRRRGFPDAASALAGMVVGAAVTSAAKDAVTSVSQLDGELDQHFATPFTQIDSELGITAATPADHLADMKEDGIGFEAIDAFDRVAEFMVDNLGTAIDQQNREPRSAAESMTTEVTELAVDDTL